MKTLPSRSAKATQRNIENAGRKHQIAFVRKSRSLLVRKYPSPVPRVLSCYRSFPSPESIMAFMMHDERGIVGCCTTISSLDPPQNAQRNHRASLSSLPPPHPKKATSSEDDQIARTGGREGGRHLSHARFLSRSRRREGGGNRERVPAKRGFATAHVLSRYLLYSRIPPHLLTFIQVFFPRYVRTS